MRAFIKSVLMGSLAASLPFSLVAVFALGGLGSHPNYLAILLGALMPMLVALAIVAPTMALIGLPATWLLSRQGAESPGAYLMIGIVAGFLIPLIIYPGDFKHVWLGAVGAFSGGITARTWWKASREEPASGTPPTAITGI